MKYYGTEGILLAVRDHREADRVLTFYTKDLGRVDAIAAGLRHSYSKLRGHLSLYNHTRIILTPGRQYWRLIDAEEITERKNISIESARNSFVQMFLRIVGATEAHSKLWDEIALLDSATHPVDFAVLKVKTLALLGMLPAPQELPQFFTSTAVAWISGMSDASFFKNPVEVTLFENGLRKILSANHML